LSQQGFEVSLREASFFLSREKLIATNLPGMAIWRERIYAVMVRNAGNVADYFNLPPRRVIEIGRRIEI
jgi:KUP system potassium uptake protein